MKLPALPGGDALGNPLRVVLGPGQQADCRRVAELLSAAAGTGNGLSDQAYDTDAVLASVAAIGAHVVVLSKKNRLVQCVIDRNFYQDRNKVERFFSRLKQFRRLGWPRARIKPPAASWEWCISLQPCYGFANCSYNL